jgi:hypothetical protein
VQPREEWRWTFVFTSVSSVCAATREGRSLREIVVQEQARRQAG